MINRLLLTTQALKLPYEISFGSQINNGQSAGPQVTSNTVNKSNILNIAYLSIILNQLSFFVFLATGRADWDASD